MVEVKGGKAPTIPTTNTLTTQGLHSTCLSVVPPSLDTFGTATHVYIIVKFGWYGRT